MYSLSAGPSFTGIVPLLGLYVDDRFYLHIRPLVPTVCYVRFPTSDPSYSTEFSNYYV